jgi:amicyanin
MKNSIILLALLMAGIMFSGCSGIKESNRNATMNMSHVSIMEPTTIPSEDVITISTEDSTPEQSEGATTTRASSRTSTTRAGGRTIKVDIKSFAFDPKTIAITRGDTVVWTNMDAAPHRVFSDIGSVKTELDSPTLAKGDTYSHTFSELGTYAYHCSIHTSMKGEIIVD